MSAPGHGLCTPRPGAPPGTPPASGERDAPTVDERAAQTPAPETLRRLKRTLLTEEGTVLGDDATVLLVEWRRGTEAQVVPQTVLEDCAAAP